MYNPRITEAVEMFERMTRTHKDEMYRSRLLWHEIKAGDGSLIQIVPVCDILFKF